MSEFKDLPQSISHKKLSYLLGNAPKDIFSETDINNSLNSEDKELYNSLAIWENNTKEILKKLSTLNKELYKNKSPNSMMALGAMEVHLNMSLQALISFKDDKSND